MGKITKARTTTPTSKGDVIARKLSLCLSIAGYYRQFEANLRDKLKELSEEVHVAVRARTFLHPLDQVKAVINGEVKVLNIDTIRFPTGDCVAMYKLGDYFYSQPTRESLLVAGLHDVMFAAYLPKRSTKYTLRFQNILAYKLHNSNDWVDFDAETFLREASSPTWKAR